MESVSAVPAEEVCPAALALAGSSVMQFVVLAVLGLWCGWSPLLLPPPRSSVTILALERLTPVRTMINPLAASFRPVIERKDSATPPPMPTVPSCQTPTAARAIRNTSVRRPPRVPRKPDTPAPQIVSVPAALSRPASVRSAPAPQADRPDVLGLTEQIAWIRNRTGSYAPQHKAARISDTGSSIPAASKAPAGNEITAYLAVVRERLERTKRFPESARNRGLEGTVLLTFRIGTDGCASNAAVRGKAPNSLRDAALALVRDRRFPAPPIGWNTHACVEIPVTYSLKETGHR